MVRTLDKTKTRTYSMSAEGNGLLIKLVIDEALFDLVMIVVKVNPVAMSY